MSITEYGHSEAFWSENQRVILDHIFEAELVYLNARNNIGADQGFFGTAATDGSNTLLAVRTVPYPLIVFGTGDALAPLAEETAAYLTARGLTPAVLNGNRASTAAILRAFGKLGVRYRAGRHLLQRRCEALADVPALELPLINANDVDYDFERDYRNFLEECHAAYDPAKLRQDIDTMLKNNDLYVLTERGDVVTMGRLQRKVPGARAVGVIYTPPKYRGKGYSLCCTKQLTRRIFEDGYRSAYLYAEADNPVSNHVYEKLGYVKTDDFIEYHRAQ